MSKNTFFPGSQRLYPILDLGSQEGHLAKQVSLWKQWGLSYYQLRAKEVTGEEYCSIALTLKQEFPDLHIIANDFAYEAIHHPDLFSGLHLGQEDLQQLGFRNSIRRLLAKRCSSIEARFILGISTHNTGEIVSTLSSEEETPLPWSYIALGPCFPSQSKKNQKNDTLFKNELLVEAVRVFARQNSQRSTDLALVLIGGITRDNAKLLFHVVHSVSPRISPVIAAIQSAREKETFLLG